MTMSVVDRPGPDPRRPPARELVGDCMALGAFIRFARCGPDGFTLAAEPGMGLSFYVDAPGSGSPPAGGRSSTTLFVSADSAASEEVLRSFAVNTTSAGFNVRVPSRSGGRESPLVAWIFGAAGLAGLVGVLALVLHLVAQSARLTRSRVQLLALGTDVWVVRRLAGARPPSRWPSSVPAAPSSAPSVAGCSSGSTRREPSPTLSSPSCSRAPSPGSPDWPPPPPFPAGPARPGSWRTDVPDTVPS